MIGTTRIKNLNDQPVEINEENAIPVSELNRISNNFKRNLLRKKIKPQYV
jgi:hypothetical protein